MMRKLRRVVELGDAIEALVERREDVDGAFALERYQESIIRVEHTLAVSHDIKDAGRKVSGFVRKEPTSPLSNQLRILATAAARSGGVVFRCAARRQRTDKPRTRGSRQERCCALRPRVGS
jgi:hypothetical protein